jgi:hypothetical protein
MQTDIPKITSKDQHVCIKMDTFCSMAAFKGDFIKQGQNGVAILPDSGIID